MSDAIAGATALNTVENILTYQAAASVDKKVKDQARKNAGITGSYGYIDNQLVLEQGLTTELLNEQRKIVEETAGIKR